MPEGSTTQLADLSGRHAPIRAQLPSAPHAPRIGLEFDDGSFFIARGHGLIGRDPLAPAGALATHLVTLTDRSRSVSRTHLEFGLGNAGLWVRDRHSTNGSEIEFDGRRTHLEPGQAVTVRPMSTIHLGGRCIRVRAVDCRAVVEGVTVEWGAATRVGLTRQHNQDTFGSCPPVFVVADGIGTHSAGDVASREAVQALLALDARRPVTPDMFDDALVDARARIARIPADDTRGRPGTTLSGVIVTRRDGVPCWLVVNIGDSRTYRLSGAELRQLTVDHSILQKLIDSGVIADDGQKQQAPIRNMLTRALFGEKEHSPDVWQLPIRPADRMLVCSDGLSSTVEDSTMRRILRTVRDPQAAANTLVDAATNAGARDDVTVVVVDAVAISPSMFSATGPMKRIEVRRGNSGAGWRSTATRARWRG